MIPQIRSRIFIRNIWKGILGIVFEISAMLLLIAAGFVVSFFWWSFFK
ncbi:MAG: hypothetical protein V1682_04140 [Candidatus Omnitrophota bacterium]